MTENSANPIRDARSDAPRTPPVIALLLDRSGSMNSCRDEALSAVNGYLEKAAADEALTDAKFNLLTFDSESIDRVRQDVAIGQCGWLKADEFVPRGLTPLFDAVAHAVQLLDAQGAPETPRVLVIMTDGAENASREHTQASIAALLTARQAAGWVVVYLGANQDAWSAAAGLGIAASAAADFSFSASGEVACALHSVSSSALRGGFRGFTDEEREKLKTG